MTLRVALDISSGLAHSAGVSRYALELAKELKLREQDGAIALRLFHNLQPLTNLPKTLAAIPRTFAPLSNKTWRAFLLSGVSPSFVVAHKKHGYFSWFGCNYATLEYSNRNHLA